MRVKYNRGKLDEVIRAALKLAAYMGQDRYVYATAFGYAIGNQRWPFQVNLVCRPDGSTEELKKGE